MRIKIAAYLILLVIASSCAKSPEHLLGVSVDPSKSYMNGAGGSYMGGTVVFVTGVGFHKQFDTLKVALIFGVKEYIPGIIYIYIYIYFPHLLCL